MTTTTTDGVWLSSPTSPLKTACLQTSGQTNGTSPCTNSPKAAQPAELSRRARGRVDDVDVVQGCFCSGDISTSGGACSLFLEKKAQHRQQIFDKLFLLGPPGQRPRGFQPCVGKSSGLYKIVIASGLAARTQPEILELS